jgi:hypothetical protein
MTSLTLVTVLVVSYGLLVRNGYGRALALGGVTGSGAAALIGSIAVPTFYAVALGTVVALGLSLLGNRKTQTATRRFLPPGVSVLLLFLIWSVLVTLVAPVIFDGMTVLVPAGPTTLTASTFTSSNMAQVVYLILGLSVVLFLARSAGSGPEAIGLLLGLTTVLSMWRYLHQLVGTPFPEGMFDNSPAFAFIETAPDGTERFRGIFSEPAGLAGSSLVTMAYMLPRSLRVRGWRCAGALLVAAAAAYLGAISTSATFVVAGVAIAVIAGLASVMGFLLRRSSVSAVATVLSCALVVSALWILPIIADFVEATVDEKVGSTSFTQRSSTNSASLSAFLDTFGFGIGLGANRASSFVPGLLSGTGIVGTLLFVTAVATLIRRSAAIHHYRPVIWALVGLLVVKVIAGPDLSDPTGVLWISLGLLSHAAAMADENHPTGLPAESEPGDLRPVVPDPVRASLL